MSENTVTGKLLQEEQDNIDKIIEANHLSKTETTLLRSVKLILKFIDEDHTKIKDVYVDYQERKERKEKLSKFIFPVYTGLALLFLTQFIYFWFDIVPKLQSLP